MQHLTIANQWISSLLHAFVEQGLDLSVITQGLKTFKDGEVMEDARIELSDARIMWHRAVAQSNDPLLGFKVGLAQDYRAVGVLAPIIWHSPTVREALQNIQRFQKLISESGQYQAQVCEETCCVHYEYIPNANRIPVAPHQVLAVITGTIGGMFQISNRRVVPYTIEVPYALDATLLEQAFCSLGMGCTVSNREGNFRLTYETNYFDLPMLGRDPYLYEINKAYAEDLLLAKNKGLALIGHVKRFVLEHGAALSSIEGLAVHMGINKRTLQRFLRNQGTSFREVKTEALKELAIRYLIHEKMEIERVANKLNYSETSAFHRAFREWFGVSPRKFGRII